MVMQPRRIRLIGHVAGTEEKADVNRVWIEKTEGRKSFGRPKHRLENYKLDLKQIRWVCMNWFNLLKPTGYMMYQQFNIQQLYAPPTLYLFLYLSENKQRLVQLTA
jgi:hypothetical protein